MIFNVVISVLRLIFGSSNPNEIYLSPKKLFQQKKIKILF